jgi:hypothetical protein
MLMWAAHIAWEDFGTEDDRADMRSVIAAVLSEWLEIADIRPTVWWPDDAPGPYVTLTEGDVFGVLAAQLAATLSAPLGLYRCDDCGYPYTPAKRRPRRGLRRYCPTCSEGASLASKRHWWRQNRSPRQGPPPVS